ncbi:hypothetical protein BV25DRAFT_1835429 [Artomyces pyxidatus]|uniref:Uncharacterized protein n=1 Tax=Artomyces pyxidatus TaxID=48021 RepID=A0ACB8TFC4_9AGAM|nr:hypothetical protein BV25DRAFT_1835429 [Artomyces pyxidatus]
MGDVEQHPPQSWMRDDNQVLLATLATLTLATSSILLWRGKRRPLPNESPESVAGPSVLQSALATLHISKLLSPNSRVDSVALQDAVPNLETLDEPGRTANADGSKEAKSSRSKERRRRGKDPLKDMTKGGKKFKELREVLRTAKRPTTASSEDLTEAANTPADRVISQPQDKLAAGFSNVDASPGGSGPHLSSPQNSTRSLTEDTTPRPSPSSRDVEEPFRASNPSPRPSTPLNVAQDTTTVNGTEPDSASDGIIDSYPGPSIPPTTNGVSITYKSSPEASVSQLVAANWSSSVTETSSSSVAEISSPSSATSSPSRRSQGGSRSRPNNNSWDWDGQSTFYRDPPPRFLAARKLTPVSPTIAPMPLSPTSAASPQTPANSSTPLDSPSASASWSRRSIVSPSPSPSPAPTRQLGRRTPTPRLPQTPPPNPVSAQTQIASLKGALEASKMREEKNRGEAERLAKECDMLRWRLNEDSGLWRRREAELHGYIQYLSQNLQMYAAASAHLQPPGTPFSPISPMSPPAAFNAYAFPPPGGAVPHPALAAFFAPGPPSAPSSTGSRSPGDRGRRRERAPDEDGRPSAADEEKEEDDSFVLSDEVAGAILRRPDSLRVKSRSRLTPPVEMGALRFPSISDLGNVWREEVPPEPQPEEENAGRWGG